MTQASPPIPQTSRQWPAIAGLWSIYAVFLAVAFVRIAGPAPVSWGQKAALAIFLIFFTLGEMGLLVLANALFERLTARLRTKGVLDAVKAVALSLLLTVLGASLVKFLTARSHLRTTDVWFVVTNFRQLFQESLRAELSSALLLAGLFVGLALALFFAFRLLRRKGPAVSPAPFAVLAAVALVGAGVSWVRYEAVPDLARLLVPEIHWLTRASASDLAAGMAAPAVSRPPIRPYDPPRVSSPTEPADGAAEAGPVRTDNVVLVMLESVPWARLSFTGAPPGITPNLDRLARESVVFTRAYAPSVHSDYAQMAILSSLFPRKYEHHDYYQQLDYPRALLWDALRPAGWRTALFSCQNETWGNMLAFLRTPGLETLMHSPDFPPEVPRRGRGTESKVFEEAVVSAWRSWLDEEVPRRPGRPRPPDGRPYFTYLNFQATHFSYVVPPEAPRPLAPHEIDFPASFLGYPRDKVPVMENRFYNALAYTDRWLGEVRRTLERRGEWEHTALVVVSDHGEAFYEHEQPSHGTALYEEQVRSVWMMRLPGEEPRWIEEPVSLMDVAPTLLAYLGLPPHGNFQGRGDVLDPDYQGSERPLFFTIQGMTFEDGVLWNDWKYMINWDQQAHRLFHLAEDPDERKDLLEREPERVERLQKLLLGFLRSQLGYYEERAWEDGQYPPRLP